MKIIREIAYPKHAQTTKGSGSQITAKKGDKGRSFWDIPSVLSADSFVFIGVFGNTDLVQLDVEEYPNAEKRNAPQQSHVHVTHGKCWILICIHAGISKNTKSHNKLQLQCPHQHCLRWLCGRIYKALCGSLHINVGYLEILPFVGRKKETNTLAVCHK